MRFVVRLGILGLAGYGAKTLYDKYSPRVDELRGPASQFVERTSGAVQDAAERGESRAALDTCTDPEPGTVLRMPSRTRMLMELAA